MMYEPSSTEVTGSIFNVQGYSIHDGPGIRTTVFMKKCPLRCLWCSNPESINARPEVMFFRELCVKKDYRCLHACPGGAITLSTDEELMIDRKICVNCTEYSCVKACFHEAIKVSGKYVTVDDVWKEIKRDIPYYLRSGGGVTLSGGEPTSQPEFALELLKRCKENGLHTALDTCGYVDWQTMKRILDYVDLVLYDIKHMDPAKHKMYTGVSNELIHKNAELMASLYDNVSMMIRFPIIKGYNDSEENVTDTARFVAKIGLDKIELLPYHKFGIGKYEKLGRQYELEEASSLNDEELLIIEGIFESYGLDCSVSGR